MKMKTLTIVFDVTEYLSALLLLTGDVKIVKFIRACLSLQLTFGIQLFCPKLSTYHTNIGPTSGLFLFSDFHVLEMELWPILTTYHTNKTVRFSQVKWRKVQVMPCLSKRSFCLRPIWGCWGEMWTLFLDFDMLEMDLWPILTTYHTNKTVRLSQVKWRKVQVIHCLSKKSSEAVGGKCGPVSKNCWSSRLHLENHLLLSVVWYSVVWHGMVWYDVVIPALPKNYLWLFPRLS